MGFAPTFFSSAVEARTTLCCATEKGSQICSDILPTACYGRAYREINESGTVVKRVDAPLTEEQRAQKEVELIKAKADEKLKLEMDRKNRALLATYATEKDIDFMRDRAVADLQTVIKTARIKYDEVEKRQKKLLEEGEFYKKKAMPPELKKSIRENENEIKTHQAEVDGKEKDIASVKARYEDERTRYRELKEGKRTTPLVAPMPSAADLRPR